MLIGWAMHRDAKTIKSQLGVCAEHVVIASLVSSHLFVCLFWLAIGKYCVLNYLSSLSVCHFPLFHSHPKWEIFAVIAVSFVFFNFFGLWESAGSRTPTNRTELSVNASKKKYFFFCLQILISSSLLVAFIVPFHACEAMENAAQSHNICRMPLMESSVVNGDASYKSVNFERTTMSRVILAITAIPKHSIVSESPELKFNMLKGHKSDVHDTMAEPRQPTDGRCWSKTEQSKTSQFLRIASSEPEIRRFGDRNNTHSFVVAFICTYDKVLRVSAHMFAYRVSSLSSDAIVCDAY